MGTFVADELIKKMIQKDINIKNSNILVLGVTFKENCPDVRNTKVIDLIKVLKSYHTKVTIFDPWANPEEIEREYGFRNIQSMPPDKKYDGIILAVSHDEFKILDLSTVSKEACVIYDIKGFLPRGEADSRL